MVLRAGGFSCATPYHYVKEALRLGAIGDDTSPCLLNLRAIYTTLSDIAMSRGAIGRVVRPDLQPLKELAFSPLLPPTDFRNPHRSVGFEASAKCHPTEAQPLTIIEALSAGTPVVVTRHSGIPDMVRENQDALFVPPQAPDAVQRLADDATWKTFSQHARQQFQTRFSPDTVRRQWVDLLEKGEF